MRARDEILHRRLREAHPDAVHHLHVGGLPAVVELLNQLLYAESSSAPHYPALVVQRVNRIRMLRSDVLEALADARTRLETASP